MVYAISCRILGPEMVQAVFYPLHLMKKTKSLPMVLYGLRLFRPVLIFGPPMGAPNIENIWPTYLEMKKETATVGAQITTNTMVRDSLYAD